MKFFALGGLNEFGKNFYVLEVNSFLILIDCGIKIPNSKNLGIDCIIPDIEYLKNNRNRIIALLISHGHEDNCGAFPYIIDNFPNIKIFTSEITIKILHKLINKSKRWKLKKINFNFVKIVDNGIYNINPDVKFKAFEVFHSIPQTFNFLINTPSGNVYYATDYITSFKKNWNKKINSIPFQLFNTKIKLLIHDSSNIMNPGTSSPNHETFTHIGKLFQENHKNRFIFSCFDEDLLYINEIFRNCYLHNLSITFFDNNFFNIVKVAIQHGYIDVRNIDIININTFNKINRGVLIITGSGKELYNNIKKLIIQNKDNEVVIKKNEDIFIPLIRSIPGSELILVNIINEIIRLKIRVEFLPFNDISMLNPSEEDFINLINILKPEFIVPIKGRFQSILRAKKIASDFIDPDNIYILNNGDTLEINKDGCKKNDSELPDSDVYIDGIGIGDVSDQIIYERNKISNNGIVFITFMVDKRTDKVVSDISINLNAINDTIDSSVILKLKNDISEFIYHQEKLLDNQNVNDEIKFIVKKIIYKEMKKNPFIFVILVKK